jgi:hypothetical protein
MEEIYKALGWQGGTIHQILNEIKRLKQLDLKCDGCIDDNPKIWNAETCPYCKRNIRPIDYYKKGKRDE